MKFDAMREDKLMRRIFVFSCAMLGMALAFSLTQEPPAAYAGFGFSLTVGILLFETDNGQKLLTKIVKEE